MHLGVHEAPFSPSHDAVRPALQPGTRPPPAVESPFLGWHGAVVTGDVKMGPLGPSVTSSLTNGSRPDFCTMCVSLLKPHGRGLALK